MKKSILLASLVAAALLAACGEEKPVSQPAQDKPVAATPAVGEASAVTAAPAVAEAAGAAVAPVVAPAPAKPAGGEQAKPLSAEDIARIQEMLKKQEAAKQAAPATSQSPVAPAQK